MSSLSLLQWIASGLSDTREATRIPNSNRTMRIDEKGKGENTKECLCETRGERKRKKTKDRTRNVKQITLPMRDEENRRSEATSTSTLTIPQSNLTLFCVFAFSDDPFAFLPTRISVGAGDSFLFDQWRSLSASSSISRRDKQRVKVTPIVEERCHNSNRNSLCRHQCALSSEKQFSIRTSSFHGQKKNVARWRQRGSSNANS